MTSLASALDLLQGELKVYLGDLLPTLEGIKHCLRNLTGPLTVELRNGIVASVEERFGSLYDEDDVILASTVHPK